MNSKLLPLAAAFAVLAAASAAAMPAAQDWEIGPVIRGKNYSQGMPPHPAPQRKGWYFDFPVGTSSAAGHVHYLTFRPESLRGKSRIVIRYRIDAAPGTRFVPQQFPDRTAAMTAYLQRRGDSWTAKGRYQFYRWYAPVATMRDIAPGTQEIVVRLDDPHWGSVMSQTAGANPREWQDALDDIDRIGLVFGSKGGRGHGVYATKPARFTMLDFRIE